MLGSGRGVLGNDANDVLGVLIDGRGVVRPVAAVLGVGGKCTPTLDFISGCSSSSTTRRLFNDERSGAMEPDATPAASSYDTATPGSPSEPKRLRRLNPLTRLAWD